MLKTPILVQKCLNKKRATITSPLFKPYQVYARCHYKLKERLLQGTLSTNSHYKSQQIAVVLYRLSLGSTVYTLLRGV